MADAESESSESGSKSEESCTEIIPKRRQSIFHGGGRSRRNTIFHHHHDMDITRKAESSESGSKRGSKSDESYTEIIPKRRQSIFHGGGRSRRSTIFHHHHNNDMDNSNSYIQQSTNRAIFKISDNSDNSELTSSDQHAAEKSHSMMWNLMFRDDRVELEFVLNSLNQNTVTLTVFFVMYLYWVISYAVKLSMIYLFPNTFIDAIADRSLDCMNCSEFICETNNVEWARPVSRYTALNLKRVPSYTVIPIQRSTIEGDNSCPAKDWYEDAVWLQDVIIPDEAHTNLIDFMEIDSNCNVLLSTLQNQPVDEDMVMLATISIVLSIQIAQHMKEILYRTFLHMRDRGWEDERESLMGAPPEFRTRRKLWTNFDYRILQVIVCYLGYFTQIYMTTLNYRNSVRFVAGFHDSECPDGKHDINSAPLTAGGSMKERREILFTWVEQGAKYILGIAAMHFTGSLRFAYLLHLSLLSLAMMWFLCYFCVKSADSRLALAVLPMIHLVFLLVVYQTEYTERRMWGRLRAEGKMTDGQRTACEQMLPRMVLKAFMRDSLDLAYRHDHVTFLFTDIVGFTNFSEKVDPHEVLVLLQSLFVHFDLMISDHRLFKVCTIGDAYVVITQPQNTINNERSVTSEDIEGFKAVLQFAYAMLKRVMDVQEQYKTKAALKNPLELTDRECQAQTALAKLAIRIGLHHGQCVGGIIGSGRIRYDIWGPDVIVGEKMEQDGKPMDVHVSEQWKDFFEEQLLKSTLMNCTIPCANDFAIADTYFVRKGTSQVQIEEGTGYIPQYHTQIKGYIMMPSYEDMVRETADNAANELKRKTDLSQFLKTPSDKLGSITPHGSFHRPSLDHLSSWYHLSSLPSFRSNTSHAGHHDDNESSR